MSKEELVKCTKEFIKARSRMDKLFNEVKTIQKLVYRYEFTAKQQVSKMNTQVKKIKKKLESIEVNYETLRTNGELLKDRLDNFIN